MTPRHNELLRYLIAALDRQRISPSYHEIAEAMAIKSKSGVSRYVAALEERGYLTREGGKNRNLIPTPAGYAAVAGAVLVHYTDAALADELARRERVRGATNVKVLL